MKRALKRTHLIWGTAFTLAVAGSLAAYGAYALRSAMDPGLWAFNESPPPARYVPLSDEAPVPQPNVVVEANNPDTTAAPIVSTIQPDVQAGANSSDVDTTTPLASSTDTPPSPGLSFVETVPASIDSQGSSDSGPVIAGLDSSGGSPNFSASPMNTGPRVRLSGPPAQPPLAPAPNQQFPNSVFIPSGSGGGGGGVGGGSSGGGGGSNGGNGGGSQTSSNGGGGNGGGSQTSNNSSGGGGGDNGPVAQNTGGGGSQPGQTPQNPIVPPSGPNCTSCVLPVPTQPGWIYYDPLVAIGYNYQLQPKSGQQLSFSITDIRVNTKVGDGIYQLWLFDVLTGQYVNANQNIFADTNGDFNVITFLSGLTAAEKAMYGITDPADGLTQFSIRGIDPNAGLDPNNPNAFITGLMFEGQIDGDLVITPLVLDTSTGEDPPGGQQVDPLPEPGTLAIFGLGLAGIALLRKRKTS